ncbi:hypothetical protein B9Q16_23735 (plasmid) [Pantoea ananatis]|nr:hypothetical protein B9Q16_23735 [Pantoea ananatis]
MISARLHDYVVKAILHKLVRADAENVRFWHGADLCASTAVMSEKQTYRWPAKIYIYGLITYWRTSMRTCLPRWLT